MKDHLAVNPTIEAYVEVRLSYMMYYNYVIADDRVVMHVSVSN